VTTTLSILYLEVITLRYAGRGSNDSKSCIFKYVKEILKYFFDKFPIHFIFSYLKRKIMKAIQKLCNRFLRCFP